MKLIELKMLIVEELQNFLNEKFTSSGTVPVKQGRKMTSAQIAKRKTIGKQILSVIKTGDNESNPLRKAFIKWAEKNDRPIDSEETMNSYVWAMASDYAIKGKEFKLKKKSKKTSSKKSSSKKKKSTGEN